MIPVEPVGLLISLLVAMGGVATCGSATGAGVVLLGLFSLAGTRGGAAVLLVVDDIVCIVYWIVGLVDAWFQITVWK